ncbi:glutathione-specific gamma-glutamylcyclotransferase 1 [Trichonephila clavata]|uniref:glutathione-specific gamma-glutamylcyclotransferase n=1 Tax=Trichonephila clavata TaxID=2740835 RepID=A0A8X6EYN9_TRICU|nr:glutathione-specific gamma-glutamylcyclotransferase 1 [Trichonephila clavata]
MTMWVFGYGSLIWNPGFQYLDSKIGYIKGFNRRFWQGNDFHRGNPTKMGRVATLVEDEQGLTWGKAFLLGPGAESALNYLDKRESKLGGYCTTVVTFQPHDSKEEAFPVLLYMALPSNHLYMGSAPLPQVATEIAEAVGRCGYNAEYLLRLVNFMKEQLPEVWDEHLYHLDHLVRARLKEMNLSIDDVMGVENPIAVAGLSTDDNHDNFGLHRGDRRSLSSSPPDYASRVPSRKLRCLDI